MEDLKGTVHFVLCIVRQPQDNTTSPPSSPPAVIRMQKAKIQVNSSSSVSQS